MMINTPRKICYGYLLELPFRGDPNKCSQHTFPFVNNSKPNFLFPIKLIYVLIVENSF